MVFWLIPRAKNITFDLQMQFAGEVSGYDMYMSDFLWELQLALDSMLGDWAMQNGYYFDFLPDTWIDAVDYYHYRFFYGEENPNPYPDPSNFKFPEGSDYATKYPKFTEYISRKIPQILKNDYIKRRLREWGHFTDTQLEKHLLWDSGLEIHIVENLTDDKGNPANGKFTKCFPDRIYLDKSLVDWIDGHEECNIQLDAVAFLIGVTLLHELVHFGDYTNNNDACTIEEGEAWELNTYGTIIGTPNAEGIMEIWLRKND